MVLKCHIRVAVTNCFEKNKKFSNSHIPLIMSCVGLTEVTAPFTWVKDFRIIPEFRILRMTFHRKSSSKF